MQRQNQNKTKKKSLRIWCLDISARLCSNAWHPWDNAKKFPMKRFICNIWAPQLNYAHSYSLFWSTVVAWHSELNKIRTYDSRTFQLNATIYLSHVDLLQVKPLTLYSPTHETHRSMYPLRFYLFWIWKLGFFIISLVFQLLLFSFLLQSMPSVLPYFHSTNKQATKSRSQHFGYDFPWRKKHHQKLKYKNSFYPHPNDYYYYCFLHCNWNQFW